MFFQDGLTGSAWGDWANYADSPLRAAAPDFSGERLGNGAGAGPVATCRGNGQRSLWLSLAFSLFTLRTIIVVIFIGSQPPKFCKKWPGFTQSGAALIGVLMKGPS